MSKIDPTIKRETGYIAVCVLVGSMLLEAVFLIIGKWDYTVLLGNLLGGIAAVGNFFLMGLTVQSAVLKAEKEAKDTMKLSQTLRTFLLFAAAAVGVLLPCFNTVAVLVTLFFPRIAVAVRPLLDRKVVPHDE